MLLDVFLFNDLMILFLISTASQLRHPCAVSFMHAGMLVLLTNVVAQAVKLTIFSGQYMHQILLLSMRNDNNLQIYIPPSFLVISLVSIITTYSGFFIGPLYVCIYSCRMNKCIFYMLQTMHARWQVLKSRFTYEYLLIILHEMSSLWRNHFYVCFWTMTAETICTRIDCRQSRDRLIGPTLAELCRWCL